jgi:hypothetical protein
MGHRQGTKFQERQEPAHGDVNGIRLGSARTPKARPRWGGGVTGIREDLGARPKHQRP